METTRPDHHPEPAKAPQLRCPGCSSMVSLPAEKCPRCRYDFRTGTEAVESIAGVEFSASRRGLYIVGGVTLLIIIGVAVLIFGFSSNQKALPIKPSAAEPAKADVGDALESFQSLSEQPLGIRPKIILDQTRKTADQVEENRNLADEIFHSSD